VSHRTGLSVRVVEAVAEAKGVDPADLDPLGEELDLEAMEAALTNSAASVRFEWSTDDLSVSVTSDGDVDVTTARRPEDYA
jgi:hypothetical protein